MKPTCFIPCLVVKSLYGGGPGKDLANKTIGEFNQEDVLRVYII